MNKEDLGTVKHGLKTKKKHPLFRCFVASKTGGNARGDGANRSVILASLTGEKGSWYQYDKLWGDKNEERALEIVKKINSEEL